MRTPISSRTRYDVLSCYNFSCFYCGARAPEVALQVDHVVPVAKGGTNKPWNLVPACHACNAGKSDSVPSEDSVLRARYYWNIFLTQTSRGRKWSQCFYCSTPVPTELEEEIDVYECEVCNAVVCHGYESGQRSILRRYNISDQLDRQWRPLGVDV